MATDPECFEGIIEGIRAEQMIEAMDLEKFHRYFTRGQNAMTKGIQALALLKETLRLENERIKQAQLQAPAIDLELAAIKASNNAVNASTYSSSNAAYLSQQALSGTAMPHIVSNISKYYLAKMNKKSIDF